MEYKSRCPYDGFRMAELETDDFGDVAFVIYECPNCGHFGCVAFYLDEPKTEASVLGCPCTGCKRERARTGKEY